MKKRVTVQTLEKMKKEDETSSDPKSSEYQFTAPWNLLDPTIIDQGTPVPKIGLKLKGKTGKFGISDQLLCMKILGDSLGQKHSQLFWGLPSLHSESIVATVLVPLGRYSLEPHLVLFNGVCRAATAPVLDHRAPAFPQSSTLSLNLVHPQPIKPQPQVLAFTRVHTQARMQSSLSSMPPPSLPCGSTCQIPQNGTISDVLNGNEHLQCHLLQNHQDSLWGLVPECQHYESSFGLLVPSFLLGCQPLQSYISIPGTDHFHFSSELQNNLEPCGLNNPIPPSCFQPYNRTEVPEVVDPQLTPTGASSHGCQCAKPLHSVHWGHTNLRTDLRTREMSHSECFCERVSVKPQLRKDVAKNVGQILGKCPLDAAQMISGCYVLNSLSATPEAEGKWVCHSRTGLEIERLSIFRKNLDQRQARSILRLHVSRKFWQITRGRIPISVCCSWLALDVPPWNSTLGNTYCDTATPEIPLLDHKTQKMLEAHLIRFRVSQKWGLPLKVTESIKFYILRETKRWPLPQSDFPFSSNSIPGMDLKSNLPNPLSRRSNLPHGDKMETANLAAIIYPLAVSPVDSKREEPLRPSHPSAISKVTEPVQTKENDRPCKLDSVSQNDATLQSRPTQEQPTKEAVAGPKPESEVAISSHIEIVEDKQRVEKSPNQFSTPKMFRKIFMTQEVNVLSGSSAYQSESSIEGNEDRNKTVSVLENSSGMSVPEEPMVSDFERQSCEEPNSKLENQLQSQTEGYESDESFASDSMTEYSQSFSNSVCSADGSMFKDTYVHLHNTRINADPAQKPRVFKHLLKDLTPDEKRLALPECRKDHGTSDTPGLEAPKAGKKSQPIKGKSDKKSYPSESYLGKKIEQFFQLFYSSKDSTRHRSEKDKALFMSCGPPEAHELMASLGKLLEDKLLNERKSKCLEWSQKERLPAQPVLIKGQLSNPAAAQHGEGTSSCSCQRTAISPGPSYKLSPRQKRPHVTFEQQPQFQSYLSFTDSRES